MPNSLPVLPLALVIAAALAVTGCGRSAPPSEPAAPVAEAEAPVAESPVEAAADEAAADEAAAELAVREQELAAQAEELARREAELAEREAAAAQAAQAAKVAAKPATPPKTAATAKPAAQPVAPAPAAEAPPPPPPPVTVPAGTAVAVKLNTGYSTKTSAVGETVNAELASDLVVDGRRVARAGAPISGTITEVTSGSQKIGAVPALKIDFTQLVVADGSTMPVAIRINQKGQSEKGRDTAKIAGGTAAGAIIGHQIDDSKGKVIGGIIGGAAGAIGAKKTGTEVELPAGSVHSANVRTAFTYDGR